MKRKLYYLATLFCLLASLNACKDEDNQPLEFYDSYYEVPMGGIRYIGPKSGNGDYNLEMEHTQIAAAGIEKGWSGVPNGTNIYVRGYLTGKTRLRVTDYATSESCVLNIKVVDNYEALQLLPADYLGEEGITTPQPLQGVDFIFLINTPSREAYFFERGEQTVFSSGLKLLVKGTYELAQEADEKVSLAFVLPEKEGNADTKRYTYTLRCNAYGLHRLDKNLALNWGTPPLNSTRTSPVTPPASNSIEESETSKVIFAFSEIEMPVGILP
mgnify:FL=1